MTLRKKYEELMDQLEVTEEMRQRILQNIQKADIVGAPRTPRLPHWDRSAAIAACFAVLLAGSLIVPAWFQQAATIWDDTPRAVLGTDSIEEYTSVDALSQAVGFPLSEVTGLPFAVERTVYTAYWAQLAQIDYAGGNGACAVYRKSIGTDDNSGRYEDYADITELTIDGLTVTLKGTGGAYDLALWADGEYAYSIWLSTEISGADWLGILANINH